MYRTARLLCRWAPLLIWLGACSAPGTRLPALSQAACAPAPLGNTTIYLRGSMNSWAALDEYAFQYHCDAYYLNVDFATRQEFKLADSGWSKDRTFGAAAGTDGQLSAQQDYPPARDSDPGGTGNLRFSFVGEHTIRLRFVEQRPSITIGPKTFADPLARTLVDPVALSVHFDSRTAADKTPFGAIKAGQSVDFALNAATGVQSATLVVETRRLSGNQEILEYQELVRLPLQARNVADGQRWTTSYRFDVIGVYGYWFELEIAGARYIYQNNRNPVFWTREKGNGGTGSVAFMPESPEAIRRYRQTVYRPDFSVPEWAPDIVYYYIFPERFRNGDPANDPKPGVQRFHDGSVEFHRNWNDKPYLNGTGDGSDERYSNDFFGGDIAGIIDKLDYIRDLGANTLYITPLFQAASNHKYDTADYQTIDPGFGSNADFSRLTAEAGERGIRVIPDTSLNHSGEDSIYFDRYGHYPGIGAFENGVIRPDSPYADWYRFDPDHAEQPYQGWVGVRDLPELNKDSASFRDFAFGKPDSVMLQWLDRGAAGWRMDVAPWVPDDFWRQWRAAIKAHRPDALTIAETWFDASKFLLGDMFDSTMNYVFRNSVLEYAGGADARLMYGNLEWLREAYPPPALQVLMNLLSTHDQARSLHVLGDHGDGDAAAAALARQRFRLAVLLQMTYPGSPTVFYGDEVGANGGDDPFNRVTYPWADLGGRPDLDMLAEFKRLIQMRKDNPVLRRGSLEAPLYLDQHSIVLLRRLGDASAIVVTNNATRAQDLHLTLPADLVDQRFVDALDGTPFNAAGNSLEITVPAQYGRVLLRQ
jgi:cyclomaltodextrinase / maltogenic alpha-amylase / neopullulanase